MALETQSPAILEFGTYEVDLRAGELRKQGKRIKLQDQPFQVLAVLLQRPNELVTREELRSQIWPENTFVDFDNSLNTSINKLREALGDSAENPRFIETLPRRGYRFIAPVKGDGLTAGDTVAQTARTIYGRKIALLAAAIVIVTTAVGGLFWHGRRERKLTEKDTLVLADFSNTTGDAVFDDALKQALRVQLEQSPFLNILSDEQVGAELQLMGRRKDERLMKDLALDLCQRVGSKAILAGTIASFGTHYVVGLNALNCHTGENLISEQVEANDREHVLKAVGESATRIRQRLGESLSSVQNYDAPVEQATTASLEALQAYSLGLKIRSSRGAYDAIPLFKRAIELDPKFAMARARLAVVYSSGIDVELSVENMREAFNLKSKVSERERFYIASHYYDLVTGEWEKAAQTYELWQQVYPRDHSPHDNLQMVYSNLGRREEALAEAIENLRLDPNDVVSYQDAGMAYLFLDRLDDAQAVFDQAMARKLQSPLLLWLRYQLAFLRNDLPQMQILVSSGTSINPATPWLLADEGMREAQHGRLENSRQLSQRAVRLAQDQKQTDVPAMFEAGAALTEAYIGDAQQARDHATAAHKLRPNRYSEPVSAFALALVGDIHGAESLSVDVNNRWPLDNLVQRYWMPCVRAALALQHENPEEAIEWLRGMGSYELSKEGRLDPIYLRGQAYLKLGNGNAAAAEFEKIIEHPGLALESPVGALTHLGLARAYALQGETAKSRAAYQDFFAMWKDADPGILILKEAKSEYAKLQ